MSGIARIDVAIVISPLEAEDSTLVSPTSAILSNLPPGAVPSAGFPCCDGEWVLHDGELDDLTVSVWCSYARHFKPRVKPSYDRVNGAVMSHHIASLGAPSRNRPAGSPAAPSRIIPFDLSAVLSSIGAADRLYDVTVTGVPAGAKLSAGLDNGGGRWTLLPEHFGKNALSLAGGFAGPVTLAFSAIWVGPGGRTHRHNAYADFWIDVEAEAGISFGPGFGRVHFVGHGVGRDTVHLFGVEHGPSDEIAAPCDWKLELDDPRMTAKPCGNGLRFTPVASGSIMLGDGNQLSFVGVTGIDW